MKIKIATATLESISPYSQSRHYDTPKKERELPKDYEYRTWADRCHVNKDGFIFIPPMAFKNCIAEAAKFLSMQVPGKGKSTYTKHFEAGVMVVDPLVLHLKKEEVMHEWLFVPSDGRRGSGSRVEKCFPYIPNWGGKVEFHLIDPLITEKPFIEHLETAGSLIGVGRFRPRNNGYYGRFIVKNVEISEE